MTAMERLMRRVSPEPNTGCWLWTGPCNAKGYGTLGVGLAHRQSFRLHVGPVPDGLYVLHKCNVRGCVNPDHLYLGDQLQNMRDRTAARRDPRGERCARAKLTNEQAAELRRLYAQGVPPRVLGPMFGIRPKSAGHIGNGHGYRPWSEPPASGQHPGASRPERETA